MRLVILLPTRLEEATNDDRASHRSRNVLSSSDVVVRARKRSNCGTIWDGSSPKGRSPPMKLARPWMRRSPPSPLLILLLPSRKLAQSRPRRRSSRAPCGAQEVPPAATRAGFLSGCALSGRTRPPWAERTARNQPVLRRGASGQPPITTDRSRKTRRRPRVRMRLPEERRQRATPGRLSLTSTSCWASRRAAAGAGASQR